MEIVQGCAVSAVSLAAITDVLSRRIPNWLTLGAFASGVAINAWLHGLNGVLGAVIGAVLGLVLLLPFYAVGGIGAGDVKLLAALGAILGAGVLVTVAIYGAIAGGVISVAILLVRGRLLVAVHEIVVEHRPPTLSGAKAPYALAIASGVYLSLILPSVLG